MKKNQGLLWLMLLCLVGCCDSESDIAARERRTSSISEIVEDRAMEESTEDERKEALPEIVQEEGRNVALVPKDVANLLELIRALKAEGKSDGEIEAGTIYLESGETVSLKEILASAARHAKTTEALFETIRYGDTPGERGYGKVLLTGKVPRKALARGENVQIFDERGYPKRPMKSSTPFFVFEDTGDHWLVGAEQDRDLAVGWVRANQCFAWPTRRLVYPSESAAQTMSLGTEGRRLPQFRADDMMPWPVLAEDRAADTLTVLADFSSIGGSIIPMQIGRTDQLNVYVLFSEKELNTLLSRLTEVVGFLESGRLSLPQIVQLLGDFLTQNRIDFLDFPEMKKVVALYPGGTPSFLMKVELEKEVKRLIPKLREQIGVLLDAVAARDFYNAAHGLYVLPMGKFGKGERS